MPERNQMAEEDCEAVRGISVQIGYALSASLKHALSATPRKEAPTLEQTWTNVADKIIEFVEATA